MSENQKHWTAIIAGRERITELERRVEALEALTAVLSASEPEADSTTSAVPIGQGEHRASQADAIRRAAADQRHHDHVGHLFLSDVLLAVSGLGVTPTAQHILLVLASRCDSSGVCDASMFDISDLSGYSKGTAIRVCSELVNAGQIQEISRRRLPDASYLIVWSIGFYAELRQNERDRIAGDADRAAC